VLGLERVSEARSDGVNVAVAVNLPLVGSLIQAVILAVVGADKDGLVKVCMLDVGVEEDTLGPAVSGYLRSARDGAQEGVEFWRRRGVAELLNPQIVGPCRLDGLVSKIDWAQEVSQAGAGAVSGPPLKGTGTGDGRGKFAEPLAHIGGVCGLDNIRIEGAPDESGRGRIGLAWADTWVGGEGDGVDNQGDSLKDYVLVRHAGRQGRKKKLTDIERLTSLNEIARLGTLLRLVPLWS